ncbi:hypothetical protein [Abyssogena phaseoliformis symbiont]|uniref:hypothetical protein n=1 Tax=Abyssogena phaseoliformis symbiont TaxID=596095 RepID=UPI001914F2F7|nr:hypothetical protein [Abyssogena phaseoliformis symbiont]
MFRTVLIIKNINHNKAATPTNLISTVSSLRCHYVPYLLDDEYATSAYIQLEPHYD